MSSGAAGSGSSADEADLTAADLVSRADEPLDEVVRLAMSAREGPPLWRMPAGSRAVEAVTAACERVHPARDGADDDDPSALRELRRANKLLEKKLAAAKRALAPWDDESQHRPARHPALDRMYRATQRRLEKELDAFLNDPVGFDGVLDGEDERGGSS